MGLPAGWLMNHGKYHLFLWMKTGGTPMTYKKPPIFTSINILWGWFMTVQNHFFFKWLPMWKKTFSVFFHPLQLRGGHRKEAHFGRQTLRGFEMCSICNPWCWYMGMSENGVYSQTNSHLVGIMISKTIGCRGTLFSDKPIFNII